MIALRVSNHLKLLSQAKALEKANYQLYAEKEHLHVTLSSIGDAVIITNQYMLVTFMNSAAERITGWKSNAAVGQAIDEVMNLRDIASGEKATNPLHIVLREKRTVRVTVSSKIVGRQKAEFTVESSASAIFDSNDEVSGGVIVFQDVTEAVAMATKMSHLIYYDQLTSLPNRLLMQDRLQTLINNTTENKRKLALLLVDIDNFKLINDKIGHNDGDAVIRFVARKLEEVVPADSTISRVGGDEFVVLLNDVKYLTYSNKIAERILSVADEQILVNNQYINISLSIGISLYPYDAKDADQLLRHADNAMYNVKRNGKKSYAYYSPYLTAQLSEVGRIERALQSALKAGSIDVHYQPQIKMASGEVMGAEALARLTDHDGVSIPPNEFIPVAEEMGLIADLGKLVLEKSCAQARRWIDQGIPCKVSVNVAAQQFNDCRFSENVVNIMKKYNVPPRYLELEITESALVADFYSAKLTLEALKRIGVSVALDDFGTGYSSLSYLRTFALDVIKIDKSFVKDLTNDKQAVCIVKAIINLAESLQLQLVCEGVETYEHETLLRSLGCVDAQGYFYSKPMDAGNFFEYLLMKNRSQGDNVCSVAG